MGQIQIRYQVAVNESDSSQFLGGCKDNFTMKWNEQQIYLMIVRGMPMRFLRAAERRSQEKRLCWELPEMTR